MDSVFGIAALQPEKLSNNGEVLEWPNRAAC